MPDYPTRYRCRQRRGEYLIEQLAKSSGGAWFVKDKITVKANSMKEALAKAEAVQAVVKLAE